MTNTILCFQIYFSSLSFRKTTIFDVVSFRRLQGVEECNGLQREKKFTDYGSKELQEEAARQQIKSSSAHL